jgi:UDP-glucose 4-epimerase
MKVLVTGSSGHLGEALVRTLKHRQYEVLGIDLIDSDFTDKVGTITDREFVKHCMAGIDTVLHTATLHKPHVATHCRQDFVDTNITGTLNLLEEAVSAGVSSFIYTSTTSIFGDAIMPLADTPATWITEDVIPVPKNIYGVSKVAAENLCHTFISSRTGFLEPCKGRFKKGKKKGEMRGCQLGSQLMDIVPP